MEKIYTICPNCNTKFQSRLIQGDQISFNTTLIVNSSENCPECHKAVVVNKNIIFE